MTNVDAAMHINTPHAILGTQEVWRIMAGDALKVIEQTGWTAYRGSLETMSWQPFVNTQINEIQKLSPKSTLQTDQQGVNISEVEQSIKTYAEQLRKRFPETGSQQFIVRPAQGEQESTKLIIEGRHAPAFGDEKTTRAYLATANDRLPSAFEALRQEFDSAGVLDHIVFAMNLEALDNTHHTMADDNAMIAYVPDSDPTVLTKLCSAIRRVKQKYPERFALTPQQEASVRAHASSEFLVPLDNTTWFCEQEKQREGRSYHTTTFADFRTTIYGGKPVLINGLPNVEEYYAAVDYYAKKGIHRIPNDRPIFAGTRRLEMPGLVVSMLK